ncbi:tartrate carrier protein [Salmonella bongori]|nr:tartrate carrier protein [Salmonella bongori]
MLVLRIISWDDIISNKAAWNVFFWLASLITLATGLNNTGFIGWFGKLLADGLSGYSPTMVMVALIMGVLCLTLLLLPAPPPTPPRWHR